MKSLRKEKRWSQEQLAELSGLNVRTIQRVEKGDSVGNETLKSLAAVFEISVDELLQAIVSEHKTAQPELETTELGLSKETEQESINLIALEKAKEKVKAIKTFYASSAFLITLFIFLMLPNYNGGENTGPLIVVFLSFAVIIVAHAFSVFQPFGEAWEKDKVNRILEKQSKE